MLTKVIQWKGLNITCIFSQFFVSFWIGEKCCWVGQAHIHQLPDSYFYTNPYYGHLIILKLKSTLTRLLMHYKMFLYTFFASFSPSNNHLFIELFPLSCILLCPVTEKKKKKKHDRNVPDYQHSWVLSAASCKGEQNKDNTSGFTWQRVRAYRMIVDHLLKALSKLGETGL